MEKVEWVLERYRYTDGMEYRVQTSTTIFTDEDEARETFAKTVGQDKTDWVFLSRRYTTETCVDSFLGADIPAGALSS